ncbi:hypothetical protein OEZ86_002300 [Tetradesmus obliquus]|nr:hypothetical protein OEZ86_002300 [Tetradesmus obliquus]
MADGVSDTAQWQDQLAGVALGGASVHRKRASTFGDPAHLHKRSSSLVSDLTIDGILSDVDCCFKCPRVLERFCPSPDALDSPTGNSSSSSHLGNGTRRAWRAAAARVLLA